MINTSGNNVCIFYSCFIGIIKDKNNVKGTLVNDVNARHEAESKFLIIIKLQNLY